MPIFILKETSKAITNLPNTQKPTKKRKHNISRKLFTQIATARDKQLKKRKQYRIALTYLKHKLRNILEITKMITSFNNNTNLHGGGRKVDIRPYKNNKMEKLDDINALLDEEDVIHCSNAFISQSEEQHDSYHKLIYVATPYTNLQLKTALSTYTTGSSTHMIHDTINHILHNKHKVAMIIHEKVHWRTILFDGTTKVISTFDPYGPRFDHNTTKRLQKCFPEYTIQHLNVAVQPYKDTINCGVWAAWLIKMWHAHTMSQETRKQALTTKHLQHMMHQEDIYDLNKSQNKIDEEDYNIALSHSLRESASKYIKTLHNQNINGVPYEIATTNETFEDQQYEHNT
jgi:hypothetical protein